MTAPAIGLPLCLDVEGRIRKGRAYHYVDASYASAVEAAGGSPRYLPIQSEPERLLDGIHGLLIPGGDDFLPDDPYPDPVEFQPVPDEQLEFDLRLVAEARRRALPIFGICYGMQLLARAAGGRLHHHLPFDLPACAEHQLDEREGRHSLIVEPDTRFGTLLAARGSVNSLHHQAVAEVGAGLRPLARAPDGVIEALETTGDDFVLGVQWHPEKLPRSEGASLFEAFVEACRAATGGPG